MMNSTHTNSTRYTSLTPDIRRQLASIVGPDSLIADQPELLEPYSHDEISGGGHTHLPEAVAFPRDEAAIRQLVELANRERFPVTVRGGGTGLAGGAVPVRGGLVIAMERLNRILDIDPDNFTVTVQPGVIVKELNDRLAETGLTFPCFPISYERCSIGGNVATNAGGGKAVKYGVTGRYVLGLRVVLPTGELVELGGKLQKNVTGYNLLPLLIGSEGTLGVITEITLRTVPLPTERQDLLALFPDTRSAIAAVPSLIARTGIVPASIEYLDRLSIQVTSRFLHDDLDYHDCGAALIFSLDGFSAERVAQDAERLRAFVLAHGAIAIEEGQTPERRERLWRVRRNLAKAFRSFSDFQTCEDISLPPARLPDMLEELQHIADEFGVQIASFGHAGDGNLHPRVVAPPDWTAERWRRELPLILAAIYRRTAALGGQLSGEHGIGEKRRDFIGLTVPAPALALMRAIKATLDPNGILNPDKILPAD